MNFYIMRKYFFERQLTQLKAPRRTDATQEKNANPSIMQS
jgi:hypothetical protein